MVITPNFDTVKHFINPSSAILLEDYEQFLASLDCVTCIDIDSGDKPWRVVTTLLHGNEPSGLIGSYQWLVNQAKQHYQANYAYNLRLIYCSVEAANLSPKFSHRSLPDAPDINRCFSGSEHLGYQQRAALIVSLIKEKQPQAIVDIHNTSGIGPAFVVAINESPKTLALTSFFTSQLILSHIHIGALMEQQFNCPIVTLECGGRADINAHQLAENAIHKLVNKPLPESYAVQVCYQPLRLRIKAEVPLHYQQTWENQSEGLTLLSDIEQCNFSPCFRGKVLGWHQNLTKNDFLLINEFDQNVFEQYFSLENGQLSCNRPVQLFMATRNADIAKSDCLFYVVAVDES